MFPGIVRATTCCKPCCAVSLSPLPRAKTKPLFGGVFLFDGLPLVFWVLRLSLSALSYFPGTFYPLGSKKPFKSAASQCTFGYKHTNGVKQ